MVQLSTIKTGWKNEATYWTNSFALSLLIPSVLAICLFEMLDCFD